MRIHTLLASFIAISTLAAGCVVDSESPTEPATEQDAERGRKKLGKADLTGSCSAITHDDTGALVQKEYCGGKSYGTCWCDEACSTYGDCCTDYDDTCAPPPPPPAECQADSDCYLHSNYCNTCACEAFPNGMYLAQCPQEDVIMCFVDPCMAQTAVCEAGQCVASGTTTPPPPPQEPSCVDNCGGSADDGACYCDDLCEGYGDCCNDYTSVCQ